MKFISDVVLCNSHELMKMIMIFQHFELKINFFSKKNSREIFLKRKNSRKPLSLPPIHLRFRFSHKFTNSEKEMQMFLPNSPGNSCWASKTKRSVHQRSCDEDAVDPGGEAVPDVEFCESSMTLLDLLGVVVIFEFQSDCGGELGRW